MKLILVRHGETMENRLHILQGQMPGRLTAKGISQINKLAGFLAAFHIDVCFTSDLRRAVDTAHIIATKHPKIKVVEDARLRERYLGKLQGQTIPAGWNGTDPYENTEPMQALYERVNSFLFYLQQNHATDTILIISHGITLKVLLSICLGYDELQFKELDDLENGSACMLEKTTKDKFFELIEMDKD
jgi:broad specificity phosphatase PhoE